MQYNIDTLPTVYRQGDWVEPAHVSFYGPHIDMYMETSVY